MIEISNMISGMRLDKQMISPYNPINIYER